MARIILVRHGQTEWNREEKFRGWVDIDLDETGRRQAQAMADRVAQWEPASVYSSPLKRAISTARPIAERLGLEVIPLEGVIDMNFGAWGGLTIAEVRERYPQDFDHWCNSPQRLLIPEGESLEEVRVRAADAIGELASRHGDDSVAVVTHRVVCKVLICHFLGLDVSHFWQIAQDTTAINTFEIGDGRAVVTLLNDTYHLRAK